MARKKGGNLKVKDSKKQKAWNFMKRNRTFRLGDLCMCIGATQNTLHSFFWTLEKVGYLKLKSESFKNKSNRVYVVLKHTGLYSPSLKRKGMYDHNTDETFCISSSIKRESFYREILNFEKEIFTAKDIRDHLRVEKSKIQPILKNLLNKEVLIIDSVGKRGEYFFKINKDFKNIVKKEIHAKSNSICPVCHSVHTSTKVKKQIQEYHHRSN